MSRRGLLIATAAGYAAAIAMLMLAAVISRAQHTSLGFYVTEPQTALRGPAEAGFVSQAGFAIWWGGAVVAVVAAALARSAALAAAAGLTTLLAFDDFFLVHDRFAAGTLGLDEKALLGVYAICAAVFLVKYRRFVLANEPWLFGAALAFFAISVGVDAAVESERDLRYGAEEGAKLLGIVSWSLWLVAAGVRRLHGDRRNLSSS